MEAFFLFVILVLLIIILSKLGSKFFLLNTKVDKIDKNVEKLQQQLKDIEEKWKSSKPEAVVEKPPVIEKPVETPEQEVPVMPQVQEVREVVKTPKPETPKPKPEVVTFQQPEVKRTVSVPQKSWFESFKEKNSDLEKFIGENLINKIGILILVLGISFFVKYAIDKDWINEPARVGIGILCGSLLMGIAHKLKKNYAAFSSVIVAGAISVFYFTIAIAFHEYRLFSQTTAFIIMVVITAFSALVSVSYNRQELAVLTLIGGFAVPFMLSTGEGNYVVLFTYIAILNAGILGIAYFKKWKTVSVLSFVFTYLLFTSWYTKELYDNTLPHRGALLFASVFYFIFTIQLVLNNIRNKGVFSTLEFIILIANNFVFFGLGMGIIHNWGIGLKGLFTLLLAVYNLIYASVLYRKFGLDKNAIYLLIGLTLTFATLTIPLQFEGNQITLFWAAEAVLLIWLSQKSKISYFKMAAILVQLLTLISLMMDWDLFYGVYSEEKLSIVLNPVFITGIVVVCSLVATVYLFKKESEQLTFFTITFNPKSYKNTLIYVTVLVVYFVGMFEINYQSVSYQKNDYSALAIPLTYHFVFSAVLVYVGLQSKKALVIKAVTLISFVNIFAYVVLYYNVPSKEFAENFYINSNATVAFYLHYILLACLIYFIIILARQIKGEASFTVLKSKPALWMLVFCVVYILSNELIVHSLFFADKTEIVKDVNKAMTNLAYEPTDDYYKGFLFDEEIMRIKKQVIKIGYPVLWGILSFVILIIGIKRNWKQLRIIALSLLGLTILKLFIYDINNVSETGKIIAFILLGVLILIISFVYQKIKKLVVDNPNSASDEK